MGLFCGALRVATISKNHCLQFLYGPAGGETFEKSRFSVLERPCGRLKQRNLNGLEHREYARMTSFEKSYPTH